MARKSRERFIKEHGGSPSTFNLVDEATVKRLARDGKVKVPSKTVNIPRDKRWNEKQIGSKILRGIENGDSIPKISKSLTEVIGNNYASAVRNARTMTTSAENHGRLDSYNELANQGVIQLKVWIATPDERTRESHLFMDGEEVGIMDTFSNGLMFPGDGDGDPEEVWNCRCTMTDHIEGFISDDGNFYFIDHEPDETIHDNQIDEEKERRERERLNREQERAERAQQRETQQTERIESESRDDNEPSHNPDDYSKWVEDDNRRENARMDITGDEYDMVNGWDGYIQTGNSFDINYAMRYDKIDTLSEHNQEVIRTLTNVIDRNELSENVRMVRMVGSSYMENTFGLEQNEIYSILNGYDLYKDDLEKFKGLIVQEKGFMSVSTDIDANVFTSRPVQLDILAPQGTPAYVTDNFGESEVVLRPDSKYEIIDFKKEVSEWGDAKLIITILMK